MEGSRGEIKGGRGDVRMAAAHLLREVEKEAGRTLVATG